MSNILIMYLIGVVLMVVIMCLNNRGVGLKEIRLKPFLLSMVICLGSWVAIYVLLVRAVIRFGVN
jgi:hypothetical protein